MRNILNVDVTKNPIDLGYANESCSLNSIYLYIKVPSITNPSIEVTLNDGTTTSLNVTSYEKGQVNSEIPLNTYKNAGSIKIRVLADDYTSEYITFSTPYELLASDNIVVKINDSGEYIARKMTDSKIVESGSNENGNWIKWEDGTMMCCKQVTFTATCNNQWGSMYESEQIDFGEMPQEFIEIPTIVTGNLSRTALLEGFQQTTNSHFGFNWIMRPVIDTHSATYEIHLIAFGDWK